MSEDSKDLAKRSDSRYSEHEYELGLRVSHENAVVDPGLAPHRVRMTDKSVKHEKSAVRQVTALFVFSILGSAFALYAYFAFPIEVGNMASVRSNTLFLGLGIT
ncbi:MAG: ubiquinol-cytochrome C reductase, partial [Rhodoluna sp.]|nr:ubiquinol-cytochrome C reductase [Rhodoluna sp.]